MMFPALTFLTAKQNLIDWMHNSDFLRYRRIIDAGAGVGAFARAVNKGRRNKLNIQSIDIIERDKYESPVTLADATRFDFEETDVLFICRPCHSIWIDKTYIRANSYGVIDMFYIGLERNVENDLYDFYYELVLENVGEDGEHLYRVFGQKSACEEYIEFKSGWGDTTQWGRKDTRRGETVAVNVSGGYQPVSDERIIRTKKATSIYQLCRPTAASFEAEGIEYAKRMKYDYPYAWLAPDGRVYPCSCCDHDTLIYDVFGINSEVERKQNWVKLYGTFYGQSNWDGSVKKSDAQMRKLKELGFE